MLPQRLIAMAFGQLGRMGIGGIMALNMAAIPALGTSTLVLDRRALPRQAAPRPLPLSLRPTPEQLQVISQVLGLSKSELARVMRITRPPLYDWLKGKSAPKDENARRLNTIAKLMDMVAPEDGRPLFSLFVTEPLQEGSPSLLECLQQESLDPPLLERLMLAAREMTAQRDQRLSAFEAEAAPRSSTPKSRDTRLDLNLTQLEWDKA
jgi:transcriptional regulator with XRE-family HTH domain